MTYTANENLITDLRSRLTRALHNCESLRQALRKSDEETVRWWIECEKLKKEIQQMKDADG